MAYVYIDDNTSPCNIFSLNIAAKVQHMYLPIEGDDTTPVVFLERAVDPLVHLLPNIQEKVKQAKLNCENPLDGLSCDESASIYLYSMRWEPHDQCLCLVLNSALHGNNQETLKPWNRYLRLLFTALDRLPSTSITFYQEMEQDFVENYSKGNVFVCWEFTSCSLSIAFSQSKQSSDQMRKRTMFEMQCYSAKYIEGHSSLKSQNEIILPPTQFQFKGYLDRKNDLDIIQLREIDSSFPLIQFITISNAPYQNPKLQRLISLHQPYSEMNLTHQNLTVEDMPIIIEQAIIGKQCTILRLDYNWITVECLSILVSGLPDNKILEELYLNNAGISDEGLQILAQTLAFNNCSINRLSLCRNHITDKGVQYLIEMLKINTKLKYLHLYPNPISKRTVEQLSNAFNNNTKISIS
jgi:hypothetical protein